jgi:hypothetical protein
MIYVYIDLEEKSWIQPLRSGTAERMNVADLLWIQFTFLTD